MKKIIHLTDTHVGYKNMADRLDALVTSIIDFAKDPGDYVIVHTGDIVEDATVDGNYEKAAASIGRLRTAGFRVLCVPGNHDYGTGGWGDEKYVEKFKHAFLEDPNVSYPVKTIIGEIAFLGLDSMADELHWYDRMFCDGELGEKQLQRLKQMLQHDDEVKNAAHRVVYLHHRPIVTEWFPTLKDHDKLYRALEGENISALLFGHKHQGTVWNGNWDIARVYDAGVSTGKQGLPHPHRVIDLSEEPSADVDARFGLATHMADPVDHTPLRERPEELYQNIRSRLRTGDLVLFSGRSPFSYMIRLATMSKWSHVGMVVKLPEYDFLTLFESTTSDCIRDLGTQEIKNGVQLVPLSERIELYSGDIAVRRIQGEHYDEKAFVDAVMSVRKRLQNRPFDPDKLELLRAAYDGPFGTNTEDLSAIFCSELVVEVYKHLGLLDADIPSNEYTPVDFSAKGMRYLQLGFSLSEEIILKDR